MTIEDVWYADDLAHRILRGALAPAEGVYRAVMRARNALYDAGVLATTLPELPAVSVGNLTVGGTGKTPVAAWIAAELRTRGARPGIVLRGYGGDEDQVHRVLTPDAVVVADRDRVRGIATAAASGCDIAVLDDAFQHRRVGRQVDLVLVSADAPWVNHCLPAGPLREPVSSLRRATVLVVTCRTADVDEAEALGRGLLASRPVPLAVVTLPLDALVRVDASSCLPLTELRGKRVLAIVGIGNPKALLRQLEAHGASVEPLVFPDHHAYTPADVGVAEARAARAHFAVCTLKDAVKLRSFWTDKGTPLMYVSQRIEFPRGVQHVHAALDHLMAARSPTRLSTAG